MNIKYDFVSLDRLHSILIPILNKYGFTLYYKNDDNYVINDGMWLSKKVAACITDGYFSRENWMLHMHKISKDKDEDKDKDPKKWKKEKEKEKDQLKHIGEINTYLRRHTLTHLLSVVGQDDITKINASNIEKGNPTQTKNIKDIMNEEQDQKEYLSELYVNAGGEKTKQDIVKYLDSAEPRKIKRLIDLFHNTDNTTEVVHKMNQCIEKYI